MNLIVFNKTTRLGSKAFCLPYLSVWWYWLLCLNFFFFSLHFFFSDSIFLKYLKFIPFFHFFSSFFLFSFSLPLFLFNGNISCGPFHQLPLYLSFLFSFLFRFFFSFSILDSFSLHSLTFFFFFFPSLSSHSSNRMFSIVSNFSSILLSLVSLFFLGFSSPFSFSFPVSRLFFLTLLTLFSVLSVLLLLYWTFPSMVISELHFQSLYLTFFLSPLHLVLFDLASASVSAFFLPFLPIFHWCPGISCIL